MKNGLLITCALMLLLVACSPSRRIARILKHNPHLIKTDTVWKVDTITVYGSQTDTVIKIWQKDTVIIHKDQLTLKYFMRSDSTVYLSGKCDTVTIIRQVPVEVNSVRVTSTPGFRVVNFLLDNILTFIVLGLILYLFYFKKNHST